MSPAITVCHHSACLVISSGDSQDGFSYPIHTLMMDSYNSHKSNNSHESTSIAAAKIQPCNYQLSKSIVHEIKFSDIAVM